tara:strand:- start:766 stop:1347 length:582 start_codon:yes stop_codon:yes gene_type:complete
MSWALVKDGSIDTFYDRQKAITLNGIQYPKNMFTLYSTSELKALGIYEVVDKDAPNWYFYDVGVPSYAYNADTDTVNEDYTVTPKNVDKLKTDLIKSTNDQGMSRIILLDWLAVRYTFDNTKAIPSAVTTFVAAVRSHCATINAALEGCSDLDDIKVVHGKMYDDDGEYNTGWPDDKDVKIYKRAPEGPYHGF